MAELTFWTGTMDAGKSTLALQTNHNHTARGLAGRLFTAHDRAGEATISSRLGLAHPAIEVTPAFDFWAYVTGELAAGQRLDHLICDEAQFYTPEQVEALARIVDELHVDVFCFGILTDFRTRLFPGSARLVELADRTEMLQVQSLCWCGKPATHNARVVDGEMVVEGEVIVVGNVDGSEGPDGSGEPPEVSYEVLCRAHHARRLTSAHAPRLSLAAPAPGDAPSPG